MQNAEEILYDQNNIKITSILLINNKSTYLISNIEKIKLNLSHFYLLKITIIFIYWTVMLNLFYIGSTDQIPKIQSLIGKLLCIITIIFASLTYLINRIYFYGIHIKTKSENIYLQKFSKETLLEIYNALNLAITKNKLK